MTSIRLPDGLPRGPAVVCAVSSFALAAALMIGCHQPAKPAPMADYQNLVQPAQQAMSVPAKQILLPTYRLNVGDQLEIIYHVKHTITPEGYRLKIEDAIDIAFPFQPQYNQSVTVTSDGTIRLLLVGQVDVFPTNPDGTRGEAGMTANQLEKELKRRYGEHLKNPELTVTVNKANIKIAELKKAITTAPRGQSRLMPLSPDGTVDLPYIGSVPAFGKTIAELRRDINAMYVKADLEEIDVTVQMNHWAPQKVFVLGEVGAPGLISTDTPISLTQAIAARGGFTVRGDQTNVLVVRRKGLPVPEGTVVDLNHLMTAEKGTKDGLVRDFSQFRYDIWMQDMDIIYVPKTGLAVFDDWVDQVFTKGIRSILPYSFSSSLNFGYELHNEPSTFTSKGSGQPNVNIGVGP
ncbi:MAG: polysaccharide biosynthesis/export family protein [Phycisphaerae bacterium]|nr:polysaccharide biosynthesis/export family protein [Phycisphaerae bacterium]